MPAKAGTHFVVAQKYNPKSLLSIPEKIYGSLVAGLSIGILAVGGYFLSDTNRINSEWREKHNTALQRIERIEEDKSELETRLENERDLRIEGISALQTTLESMNSRIQAVGGESILDDTSNLLDDFSRPYIGNIDNLLIRAQNHPNSLEPLHYEKLIEKYGIDNYEFIHDFIDVPFENSDNVVVTSEPGPRTRMEVVDGEWTPTGVKMHYGIDLTNREDRVLVAQHDMRVIAYRDYDISDISDSKIVQEAKSRNWMFGRTLYAEYHVEGIGYFRERFSHLARDQDIPYSVGEIIEEGDVIGRIGSTGVSTGPHLDWGVYYSPAGDSPWNYVNILKNSNMDENVIYITEENSSKWQEMGVQFR